MELDRFGYDRNRRLRIERPTVFPSQPAIDHVVGMDSLVHYDARDIVRVVAALADRTRHSMVFTFAPKTALLAIMHTVGRVLPRGQFLPCRSKPDRRRLDK